MHTSHQGCILLTPPVGHSVGGCQKVSRGWTPCGRGRAIDDSLYATEQVSSIRTFSNTLNIHFNEHKMISTHHRFVFFHHKSTKQITAARNVHMSTVSLKSKRATRLSRISFGFFAPWTQTLQTSTLYLQGGPKVKPLPNYQKKIVYFNSTPLTFTKRVLKLKYEAYIW